MKLVYYENDQKKEYPISLKSFVIGRHASCELVIRDLAISRRHVQINVQEDQIEIQDLGSRNGLSIGGEKVQKGIAKDGDEIGLGKFKIVFFLKEEKGSIPQEPATMIDEEFGEDKEEKEEGAKTGPIPAILDGKGSHSKDLPQASLQIVTSGGKATYNLDRPKWSLGTDTDNDIVLVGDGISRHHTEVCYGANGWGISDLGSRNGTYVNRVRISSGILRDGDIINIGPVQIRFIEPEVQPIQGPTAEERRKFKIAIAVASGVIILLLFFLALGNNKQQQAPPDQNKTEGITKEERFETLILRGINSCKVGKSLNALTYFETAGEIKPQDKEPAILCRIAEIQGGFRQGQDRSDIKLNTLVARYEEIKDSKYPKIADFAKEQIALLVRELEDRKIISESHDAFQKGDWKNAWLKYKSLPEESLYYGQYKGEIAESQKNYRDYLVKEAKELAEKGKMSEAINKLEEAQTVMGFNQQIFQLKEGYKENIRYEAIMQRARQAMQAERFNDAQKVLKELPPGTMFDAEARDLQEKANRAIILEKVNKAFREGEGVKAIAILEREKDDSLVNLKKTIEKVLRLNDEAEAAMEKKNYKEANKNWAALITLIDDPDNFYLKKAHEKQRINPKDEAIRLVEEGETCLKKLDFKNACRAFKDALKIDHENVKAREGENYLKQQASLQYNTVLNKLKDKEEIIPELEKLLEWIDPLWPVYPTIKNHLDSLKRK